MSKSVLGLLACSLSQFYILLMYCLSSVVCAHNDGKVAMFSLFLHRIENSGRKMSTVVRSGVAEQSTIITV